MALSFCSYPDFEYRRRSLKESLLNPDHITRSFPNHCMKSQEVASSVTVCRSTALNVKRWSLVEMQGGGLRKTSDCNFNVKQILLQ